MVITEHFAWAHMGKTGGDATAAMFAAVPGLVEWASSPQSNAKHDPFALHEAAIAGRLRVMNIRRLPSWILSVAQHRAAHGAWPDYEPQPMPSVDEMAATIDADGALRRVSDGPRFPIQWWLRQEFLADDVAALLEHFGQLTESARDAIASVPHVGENYDHDLAATFSAEQVQRMYAMNPRWAEVESRVYGGLFELVDSHPSQHRPRGEALRSDELDVDRWLTLYAGSRLDAIDRRLAREGPSLDNYQLFRGLDDWVWALLLGRRYTRYLSILETLPQMPEPALQARWSGGHGLSLLTSSFAFYRHVRSMHATEGIGELPTAQILDFGCGWGRLTRFFCRDVDPGCLHGCDPDEDLLQVCRRSRLPAVLHQTGYGPGELPETGFDLAYSATAFTHLPEGPAEACLAALHESLNPSGLLILTVRPPAQGGSGSDSGAPIGLDLIRERWAERFELVDVTAQLEDIDRVAVTLRKV
jgi:hypothetical protein